MQEWFSQFVAKKTRLATSLNAGECEGTYADAAIILCSTISSIAATLWPGNLRIDKKRFVEALVHYSDPSLCASLISVPVLMEDMKGKKLLAEIDTVKSAYPNHEFLMFPDGHDTRVLCGEDVDKSEKDLLCICPALRQLNPRRFSYASLLYTDVRSSFAHEYAIGDRAAWHRMTSRTSYVSYVNRGNWKYNRLIHFSFEWLSKLTSTLASSVEPLVYEGPRPLPAQWWLENTELRA